MKVKFRTIGLVFAMTLAACQVQCSRKNGEFVVRNEKPSIGLEPRITLKVKYPPGRYRMIQSLGTFGQYTDRVGEQKWNIQLKQKLTQWMSVDVKSDPAGDSTLTVRIDRIRQEFSDGSKSTTADTDDPRSLKGYFGAESLSEMIGAKITMKCNAEGRISDVQGTDDPRAAKPPQKTSAAAEFEELVTALNKTPGCLPGGPVGVGAIWYVNSTEGLMISSGATESEGIEVKCKLIELRKTGNGRIAVIEWKMGSAWKSPDSTSGGSETMKSESSKMNWTGRIEMNADTGLITKISSSMGGEISESETAEGKASTSVQKGTGTYEITLTPIK